MAPNADTNGTDASTQGPWREWARHVLSELTRFDATIVACQAKMQEIRIDLEGKLNAIIQRMQADAQRSQDGIVKDISDLRVEIAMLKVKAGVWGAIGALIPIITTFIVGFIIYLATKGKGP